MVIVVVVVDVVHFHQFDAKADHFKEKANNRDTTSNMVVLASFCSQPPPVFAAGGGMSLAQRKRAEEEACRASNLNKRATDRPTRSNRECVRTIDNKQQPLRS